MAKTRVPKMIIGMTLLLAVIAALLVFKPSTGAVEANPQYTGRGDYQRFEARQSHLLYTGRGDYQRFETQQSKSATGGPISSALTSSNCYSDLYHAASDCDRLASGTMVVSLSTLGPTANACFSSAFHAASDCDRLASSIPAVSLSTAGPTSSVCFSAAYHAASDCDRLATEINVASTNP